MLHFVSYSMYFLPSFRYYCHQILSVYNLNLESYNYFMSFILEKSVSNNHLCRLLYLPIQLSLSMSLLCMDLSYSLISFMPYHFLLCRLVTSFQFLFIWEYLSFSVFEVQIRTIQNSCSTYFSFSVAKCHPIVSGFHGF